MKNPGSQDLKKARKRQPAELESKLEKKLIAYAAMAGAGVAVLSAAQTSEAKVVYTPANTTVIYGNPVPIDLNHDGITDLTINLMGGFFHSEWLMVKPTTGNGALLANSRSAAAGFFGVPVGPGEKFGSNVFYSYGARMADAGMYDQSSWFVGPWANATNRFLGLKFTINGQTHFGWARMSVGNFLKGGQIVITGYAYETTPNTTILEGHLTSVGADREIAADKVFAPAAPPVDLGMLARGADSLAVWRRDKENGGM